MIQQGRILTDAQTQTLSSGAAARLAARCQLDPSTAVDHLRLNCVMRRAVFRERYEAVNLTCSEMKQSHELLPMNILPVDRALSLYGTLANRSETKGARERLSRHLMKLYIGGEKDEHRLTVHGLSYLRELDRAINSRN